MKIMIVEGPPPPPPPSGQITSDFSPGISFIEGIAASVDLNIFFAGNPIAITLNKDPTEDLTIPGVTYNPTTQILSYDGTLGTGRADNFIAAATDGSDAVHEKIYPYAATRPWQGPETGPGTGQVNENQANASPTGTFPSLLIGPIGEIGYIQFDNAQGDWFDADQPPARQGTVPWATWTIPGASNGVHTLDVTALVQAWFNGLFPNYGMSLRFSSGNNSTRFRSQVYNGGSEGPFLDLVYTDSSTETIAATCACDPATGAASRTVDSGSLFFSAGTTMSSLVFFPLTGKTKKVRTATFRATAFNTFGTYTIKVYATRWEGQIAGTDPTYGIAANYTRDNGLESDPDIFYMDKFPMAAYPNLGFDTRGAWQLNSGWNSLNTTGKYHQIIGATDPDNPSYAPLRTGMTSFRVRIPTGEQGGNRLFFQFYPWFSQPSQGGAGPPGGAISDPREMWVRWYFRLGDNFRIYRPYFDQATIDHTGHGGHASGLENNYCDNGANNGGVPFKNSTLTNYYQFDPAYLVGSTHPFVNGQWSMVHNFSSMMDAPNGQYMEQANATLWDIYRHDRSCTAFDAGSGSPVESSRHNHRGLLQRNRWYCVEMHVKMNTTFPTVSSNGKDPANTNLFLLSDGIEEMWIDGRLSMQLTNVYQTQFTKPGIAHFAIQSFFGGPSTPASPGPVAPFNVDTYFANMAFSLTGYIGPMKG